MEKIKAYIPEFELDIDIEYMRSLHGGVLKSLQMIFNLLAFALVAVSPDDFVDSKSANFFAFITMTGVWLSFILTVSYLFKLQNGNLKFLPWLQIEVIYDAVAIFFIFISTVACLTISHWTCILAGILGLFSLISYVFDFYLKFKSWKYLQKIDETEI